MVQMHKESRHPLSKLRRPVASTANCVFFFFLENKLAVLEEKNVVGARMCQKNVVEAKLGQLLLQTGLLQHQFDIMKW